MIYIKTRYKHCRYFLFLNYNSFSIIFQDDVKMRGIYGLTIHSRKVIFVKGSRLDLRAPSLSNRSWLCSLAQMEMTENTAYLVQQVGGTCLVTWDRFGPRVQTTPEKVENRTEFHSTKTHQMFSVHTMRVHYESTIKTRDYDDFYFFRFEECFQKAPFFVTD